MRDAAPRTALRPGTTLVPVGGTVAAIAHPRIVHDLTGGAAIAPALAASAGLALALPHPVPHPVLGSGR